MQPKPEQINIDGSPGPKNVPEIEISSDYIDDGSPGPKDVPEIEIS